MGKHTMAKKKKPETASALFTRLSSFLNQRCQEAIRTELDKLQPYWQDSLCKALIKYVETGRARKYKGSRVMQKMFEKTTFIINTHNNS